MKHPIAIVLMILAILLVATASAAYDPGTCLSDDEALLLELINQHRTDNGQPPIGWSRSLSEVAQWHVWDLVTNRPDTGVCDYRSWSNLSTETPVFWSPVCFLPGSADLEAMWNKPSEISSGVYTSPGFEITVIGSVTPALALALWTQSPPHNDMLLNLGVWAGTQWSALGVGRLGDYTVAWFGQAADSQVAPGLCSDLVFADRFESTDTIQWSDTQPRCPCWTLRQIAGMWHTSGPLYCWESYNEEGFTNADWFRYYFEGAGPMIELAVADAWEGNGGFNMCMIRDFVDGDEISRGLKDLGPVELQICRDQVIATGQRIGAPCW